MRQPVRAIVLASCLAGGCSIGPIEISNAPLSGVIGGVAWSLGSAETNAFLSMSDHFNVVAYPQAIAPCTNAAGTVQGNWLILNVPKQTGDYLLGSGINGTFYVQSSNANFIATQGRVVINQVTDTMLSGGMNIQLDGNNDVDGQFSATICPQ
jgi:hypothetical protein